MKKLSLLIMVLLAASLFACGSAPEKKILGKPGKVTAQFEEFAQINYVVHVISRGIIGDDRLINTYFLMTNLDPSIEIGQVKPGFLGYLVNKSEMEELEYSPRNSGQICQFKKIEQIGQIIEVTYKSTTTNQSFVDWCAESAPKSIKLYSLMVGLNNVVTAELADVVLKPIIQK